MKSRRIGTVLPKIRGHFASSITERNTVDPFQGKIQ